jgi:hypothetical protein
MPNSCMPSESVTGMNQSMTATSATAVMSLPYHQYRNKEGGALQIGKDVQLGCVRRICRQ